MRQVAKFMVVVFTLGMAGLAVANEEADAIRAECTAQAEEQGVDNISEFVANCIAEKKAEQ